MVREILHAHDVIENAAPEGGGSACPSRASRGFDTHDGTPRKRGLTGRDSAEDRYDEPSAAAAAEHLRSTHQA